MSASSKKKLRKDQDTAKLTERQLTEQKEAKKLRIYTIAFVAAVAVMLLIAIVVGVNQTITSKGLREKNTVAVTIGEHKLSNAQLNYYYMSIVNQYASYASYMGLDTTTPLDEQILDQEAGTTWADSFLDMAVEEAKAVYAMVDEANAAGYTLPEDTQAELDSSITTLSLYATIYGYSSADDYVKAMFGNGSSLDSYREYMEMGTLAQSYKAAYEDSLTYTEADLRAAEEENYNAYSSYSYHSYYLAATRFRQGGTTDENGTTTYSDEEKAAAVTAAKEAADSLVSEELTDVAALDEAIAALSINAESTSAASTGYADNGYSSVNSIIRDWVTDDSRKAGDRNVIASTSTSTDDDGNETTTTNGYYVVWFEGSNDNTFALKNVHHILVSFEGGTTDDNGTTTYSDEEKAVAKETAETLLEQWKNGDATEESFAALANEESTDGGSNTNGGLYEDIYPGQMVDAFNDWCYDESREPSDTGIVETEYGYHVMYFVGDSDTNYRDYQIESALRSEAVDTWYTDVVAAIPVTLGNTKYLSTHITLG